MGLNIWEFAPQLVGTELEKRYRDAMDLNIASRIQFPSLTGSTWYDIAIYPSREGISVYWIDITERKRLEDHLSSQAQVLNNVHDAIIAADDQLTITAWNRAASDLYGFTEQEALGKNICLLIRSDPGYDVVSSRPELKEDNHLYSFEAVQYGKDDQRIVVEGQMIAIQDSFGKTTGYVTSTQNITERSQIEMALRKSQQEVAEEEERFKASVENMIDGYTILNAVRRNDDQNSPGRIIDICLEYINEAGCRMLNKAREELIGRMLSDIYSGHEKAGLFDRYLRVIETGEPGIHEFQSHKDIIGDSHRSGNIYENRIVKLGDGVAVTWRDISERVRSKTKLQDTLNALSESEWRLQLAHEAARLGTWNWKAGDSFAVCSETFFLLHGVEPTPDRRFDLEHYLSLIHPEDRDRVGELTRQAIQGIPHGEIADKEFRIVLPDGSIRWVEAYQRAILDGGKMVGITGVTWDITSRKDVENSLNRYTRELEVSVRDLEAFVSVVSHDLQEPLRKVIVFGQELLQSASPRLDPEDRDRLERMQRAAERMSAMLTDLLAYSSISARDDRIVEVNLEKIVEEVFTDLEVQINNAGAVVEVGQTPSVWADPVQMRHLFLNLVGNAIKFHRPGVAPEVKIRSRGISGDQVQIEVADNGIGFDSSMRAKIFEPFARLVSRSDFPGSGIGLATCRKIIEHHGGEIEATGEPGRGATFTVTLPVHKIAER